MQSNQSISPEDLTAFRRHHREDPLSRTAAGAVSRTPIDQVCWNQQQASHMTHTFSLEIPTLEACDQKASGRCWIFAALNLLREKVAKDLDLENFQLSQNYIAFYDHLEKANTFLENILSTAGDPLDDRYVSRLLALPVGDGGWWEYFVGLCVKYGTVPQEAMPDTYQSCHTESMNTILNMQLRKDALVLRTAKNQGEDETRLRQRKQLMLDRVYHFLALCLGEPPETFDFEYVGRDKVYHAHRDLTPESFYARFIGRNVENIVSILNAPIPSVPFYRTCYTLGEESIYGSYQAKRLNLPIEDFKAAVIRQLRAGEPVWFVCDCDYYGSQKEGIWDTVLYDYESLFGLDLQMEKGDLLDLRQCSLNHAMVFTGVNLVDGRPDKWKIQNSWGTEKAREGYFVCSDSWFDRYVYTASIDRKYLTPEENRLFDQEPMILAPWNVLG